MSVGDDPAPGARAAGAERAFFQEACAYASRKHRFQLRKDGKTPYAAHLWRVSLTASHLFGCDDAVAIQAAILHDLIEDTTTDFEDIADRFGRPVAEAVAALTKNAALPEQQREREYDAGLARGPWQARLVKLADTFDNLCDVQDYDAHERPKRRREAIERAERAIALARGDAADHACMARGIELLEALVAAQRREA